MSSNNNRKALWLAGLATPILAVSLAGCTSMGWPTVEDSGSRRTERRASKEILSSLETMSASAEQGKQEPAGYPVKLVFATPEGTYIENVKVSFQKEGESREVFSKGPWLYVKGDPGRYSVQAEGADGMAASTNFDIPESGTQGPKVVILSLAEGGAGRGGPSSEAAPNQPGQNPPGENPSRQNQPEPNQPEGIPSAR